MDCHCMDECRFLSPREYARKFRCSEKHVRRLLRSRRIAGAQRLGRIWRIPFWLPARPVSDPRGSATL
jgi:hypothetical protein